MNIQIIIKCDLESIMLEHDILDNSLQEIRLVSTVPFGRNRCFLSRKRARQQMDLISLLMFVRAIDYEITKPCVNFIISNYGSL